jgi:hypothetical protein
LGPSSSEIFKEQIAPTPLPNRGVLKRTVAQQNNILLFFDYPELYWECRQDVNPRKFFDKSASGPKPSTQTRRTPGPLKDKLIESTLNKSAYGLSVEFKFKL